MEESPIEKLKLSVQNNKLLSFIVQKLKAVSSEKLKDFAEGRVPKVEAEAEGIASQIKKKYYELYLETHGF